jgi:hypothetical protein
MTCAPSKSQQRTCLELGLCQNRKPLCDDCLERPLRLAPGVVDGPFRRQRAATIWARKAGGSLRTLVAWLMGPHP